MVYDALGRRVEQSAGGVRQMLYGPGGEKLALMNGQSVVRASIGLPGGAAAVYTSGGLSRYRHADWLGSSRIASTPSRTLYYDGAYAPFGETISETGTTDRSFTGQNQDLSPNLYDFLFREYRAAHGRWISPDPAGAGLADPEDPQSWNRYTYVLNDPTSLVDPYGLNAELTDDQFWCLAHRPMFVSPDWWAKSMCGIGGGGGGGGRLQPPNEGEGGGGGASRASEGQTGIRAPGQSFRQCMEQRASDFSIAGFTDATRILVNGRVPTFQLTQNFWTSTLLGNNVTGLYFGVFGTADQSARNALTSMTNEGAFTLVPAGIGQNLTAGRRTASIMSLNFKGRPGTAAQVLKRSPVLRSVLGTLAKAGLYSLLTDIGLTLGEAYACSDVANH